MAKKKILLGIALIVTVILSSIMIVLPTYAATSGFSVAYSITQNPTSENRTATIVLSYSGGSTNAIGGTVSYDTDFFESVKMNATTGSWSTSYENSKFTTITMESNPPESGNFATITATVKSGTTLKEGTITLTNLNGGDAGTASDVTIKVTLKDDGSPVAPDDGNKGGQGSSSQNSGSSSNSGSKVTPKSSTTSTTSKASNLPKTGIVSWIGILVVAGLVVAVIELIKYKKSTK